MPEIPRLVPDEKFPPYSYVPGLHPHPQSDPEGHSYGVELPTAELVAPDKWRDSREYLWGIDLFNHGYYWEAHETWESLWHAAGRKGMQADFLKGLIKLAAAGVKARQRMEEGVCNHARRARELFAGVRQDIQENLFMGLSLSQLMEMAHDIARRPMPRNSATDETEVAVVFPLAIQPTN